MASGFILALTLLTISAISLVLLDKWVLEGRRKTQADRRAMLGSGNSEVPSTPKVVKLAQDYWHWLVLIYLIRAFGFESFSIPSTSMMPNMQIGDQIIVKKFAYGLHDPIFRHQLMTLGEPERGDIVVFKNPEHPDVDFVKRIIGVPGDTVTYEGKTLSIQHCDEVECRHIPIVKRANGKTYIDSDGTEMMGYSVSMDGLIFEIAQIHTKWAADDAEEFTIPENHYFVLGDNRDNSYDSRGFGLISHDALVGQARGTWFSWPW
jgi:signal peptidase I